jgi:hypothetical protein
MFLSKKARVQLATEQVRTDSTVAVRKFKVATVLNFLLMTDLVVEASCRDNL